MDDRMDHAL
jgi:hypothetical protein